MGKGEMTRQSIVKGKKTFYNPFSFSGIGEEVYIVSPHLFRSRVQDISLGVCGEQRDITITSPHVLWKCIQLPPKSEEEETKSKLNCFATYYYPKTKSGGSASSLSFQKRSKKKRDGTTCVDIRGNNCNFIISLLRRRVDTEESEE